MDAGGADTGGIDVNGGTDTGGINVNGKFIYTYTYTYIHTYITQCEMYLVLFRKGFFEISYGNILQSNFYCEKIISTPKRKKINKKKI